MGGPLGIWVILLADWLEIVHILERAPRVAPLQKKELSLYDSSFFCNKKSYTYFWKRVDEIVVM